MTGRASLALWLNVDGARTPFSTPAFPLGPHYSVTLESIPISTLIAKPLFAQPNQLTKDDRQSEPSTLVERRWRAHTVFHTSLSTRTSLFSDFREHPNFHLDCKTTFCATQPTHQG